MTREVLSSKMNLILVLIICFAVILIAAIVITHFVTKRVDEKWIFEFQDSVLKKQRDEVENVYNTMRGWRHDYHNHMQTFLQAGSWKDKP